MTTSTQRSDADEVLSARPSRPRCSGRDDGEPCNKYPDHLGPCVSARTEERDRQISAKADKLAHDPVNHPRHYTAHPSGIECIQVTEHLGFCVGNAIKYLWRAGLKGQDAVQDLKKARWYIDREIKRLGGEP